MELNTTHFKDSLSLNNSNKKLNSFKQINNSMFKLRYNRQSIS